ncbi:hypothetical protein HG530_001633 [Fusarium avenaceum]|nr:hypothetical protein HG530_001633 [Fusarium avenaceum]
MKSRTRSRVSSDRKWISILLGLLRANRDKVPVLDLLVSPALPVGRHVKTGVLRVTRSITVDKLVERQAEIKLHLATHAHVAIACVLLDITVGALVAGALGLAPDVSYTVGVPDLVAKVLLLASWIGPSVGDAHAATKVAFDGLAGWVKANSEGSLKDLKVPTICLGCSRKVLNGRLDKTVLSPAVVCIVTGGASIIVAIFGDLDTLIHRPAWFWYARIAGIEVTTWNFADVDIIVGDIQLSNAVAIVADDDIGSLGHVRLVTVNAPGVDNTLPRVIGVRNVRVLRSWSWNSSRERGKSKPEGDGILHHIEDGVNGMCREENQVKYGKNVKMRACEAELM